MAKKLLTPEEARAWLQRRYAGQHRAWLGGEGAWPLSVPLGEPTERVVAEDATLVRRWVDAWRQWTEAGEVQWVDRRWPRLGSQQLPSRLVLHSASEVARVLGEADRFARATQRYARLLATWSGISGSPLLARNFEALADYTDDDFERLFSLLKWFERNPASSMYLRQLPIPGVDTKWCNTPRRALITDLLLALRGSSQPREFHELCGLRQLPQRLRVRLLCRHLQRAVGGLSDVEAPLEHIAALNLQPECVLVVENLETGIALPELPGCVAFMKLGNGVGALSLIPWLKNVRAVYWGDIDTHGFAILGQARAALPGVSSILMDQVTLLDHRPLWGREPTPFAGAHVYDLTAEERLVFEGLRANLWGQNVRLEQERLPWPRALEGMRRAGLGNALWPRA